MKRILASFFVFVMLLSAVPAFAANIRTSGLYTYEIKGNGTITITDFDWENNSGDIFIPNMIDGYTVTGIGNEAFACGYNQNKTEYTLTLPEGITTIGNKAFWYANINAINIPNSLQHIGSAAFYGCASCQFKLTPNHQYFAVIDEGLYSKAKKELIAYSWKNVDTYRDETICIPEGIQSIGAYVFDGALDSGLDDYRISLPTTLTSIGDYAFCMGEFIEFTGNLPNLKIIGEGAFLECEITGYGCNLIMPAVELIGDEAFSASRIYNSDGCSIDFTGSPLTQIGNGAFSSISAATPGNKSNVFIVPTEKCTNIGINNEGLGSIMTKESDFSPALTTIPTGLNPRVTSLPSTVTAIESGAFTKEAIDFRLSMSLTDIAVDAFPKGSTFIVDAGSYAELWCSENGFGYTIEGQEDDLSWLNS